MKQKSARGAWGVRLLIRIFSVVFGILFFWLLGFVVLDIESIPGPDYHEIEKKHVSAELVDGKEKTEAKIADLERDIENNRARQLETADKSKNLQTTINQLLELQKLSIEKETSLSQAEKDEISASLKSFLAAQADYQRLNQDIAALTAGRQTLGDELRRIEHDISEQQKPAKKEYDALAESHRLWLAFYQLAILLPLLLIFGYLLVSRRGGIYFPLLLGVGGATLLKAALVMHEYFPSRYFKYVLIAALLAVVARLLVYLIRSVAFPKRAWLARQYREAYERFLCPICEYPIRTGPRKYLYWTRRTIHKILPQGGLTEADQPYTCPSCGTTLFEPCTACGKIRHSLLPNCEHCGADKEE